MPDNNKPLDDDPGVSKAAWQEIFEGLRWPVMIWIGLLIILSLFHLQKTLIFNFVMIAGGLVVVGQLFYILPYLGKDEEEKAAVTPEGRREKKKGLREAVKDAVKTPSKPSAELIPGGFRDVPWGASAVEVRANTPEKLGRSVDGSLTGVAELAGLEFDIRFVIENDKLTGGRYSTEAVFDGSGGDLTFAFIKVLRTLEKKYGKGKGGAKWMDEALKGSEVDPEKFGPYVARGELRLKNWWDGPKTKIVVEMEGGQGMQSLVIRYEEKKEA